MDRTWKAFATALTLTALSGSHAISGEITIAIINNGHMITMQELTPSFEAANPGIKVNWVTLDEGNLRQRVTTDIATNGGQFDIMTIGMYQAPIWGKREWLVPLEFGADYDQARLSCGAVSTCRIRMDLRIRRIRLPE